MEGARRLISVNDKADDSIYTHILNSRNGDKYNLFNTYFKKDVLENHKPKICDDETSGHDFVFKFP